MSVLRNTLGTALAGGAQALNLASKVLEATARTLRPGAPGAEDTPIQRAPGQTAVQPPAGATSTAEVIAAVEDQLPEVGRIVEPTPTPMLDETPHVRTSESHIEELAEKPVGQVVAAVADLSTDELRLLTEYEMAHRNRRTVLGAIEKALAPDLVAPNANGGGTNGTAKSKAKPKTRGQSREIILPEAGGVPTSGTIDPSKSK